MDDLIARRFFVDTVEKRSVKHRCFSLVVFLTDVRKINAFLAVSKRNIKNEFAHRGNKGNIDALLEDLPYLSVALTLDSESLQGMRMNQRSE